MKYGKLKFVGYQPACDYFHFNCIPSTNWVEIDKFLGSFYQFDVTLFTLICGLCIFGLLLHTIGHLLSDDISHLNSLGDER